MITTEFIERNLNYFLKDSLVNICRFAAMGSVTTVILKNVANK